MLPEGIAARSHRRLTEMRSARLVDAVIDQAHRDWPDACFVISLRRWDRPLTARLPAVPAAVPIYSAAGDTRVLVIDLDASRGGTDAVRRDTAAVTDLVRAAGRSGHRR